MKALFLAGGIVLALVGELPGAPTGEAVVNREPAVITRRTFDPANPPPEMPKLTPPEVGTCVYSFGCTTELEIRGKRGRPARVTQVQVNTRLKITLWTPQNGAAKILAHEEGHRAIAEYYYGPAESIARRLAAQEIGRTLSTSVHHKPAVQIELRRIQDDLIAEYLRETATRCDFAQARFDAITQDSINSIPESEAIVQALAEEKAAYANLLAARGQEIAASTDIAQRREP